MNCPTSYCVSFVTCVLYIPRLKRIIELIAVRLAKITHVSVYNLFKVESHLIVLVWQKATASKYVDEPAPNHDWKMYFWIMVYSFSTALMSYSAYVGVKIMPVSSTFRSNRIVHMPNSNVNPL